MTLILELEPEVERQLEIEAARLGVSKESRASDLLKTRLMQPRERLSEEEIARRLKLMDEFIETAREYSKNAPRWNDEDISRESIYGERGL